MRNLLFTVGLTFTLSASSVAQESLVKDVVGAGATEATGGGLRLLGTVGEPAIGPTAATALRLGGGFWYTATGALPIVTASGAPVAVDDAATTRAGTAVMIDVLANDSDPDGDALAIESFTQPSNGETSLGDAGGAIIYTPAEGFTGEDSFTYTATDGQGGSATAAVAVTVTEPVGPPPVASGDELVPIPLPSPNLAPVETIEVDPITGEVYVGAGMGAWARNDNGLIFRTDQLARWDGEWTALGSIERVFAVLTTGTETYVGGAFTRATQDQAGCDPPPGFGDYPLFKVARLIGPGPCAVNEHDWVYDQVGELADGAPNHVRSLDMDDAGRLFAGGKGLIGPSYHFGVFDGSWTGLGGGFYRNGLTTSTEIYVVRVDPITQDVYVGGQFDAVQQPDGSMLEVHGIAAWNGESWEPIGGGVCRSCTVSAIEVAENGDLYIGGRFLTIFQSDGTSLDVKNLATWNGDSWSAFGAVPSVAGQGITDIEIDDDRSSVYIVGTFRELENPDGSVLHTSGVARWDDSARSWNRLGDGLAEGDVGVALTQFGCTLYLGTRSGSDRFYAYDACAVGSGTTADDRGPEIPTTTRLHGAYPNPFNPTTLVSYDLAHDTQLRLSVIDMLGREVAVLADGYQTSGTYEVSFSADRLSSGTFLIRLLTERAVQTSSVVVLK